MNDTAMNTATTRYTLWQLVAYLQRLGALGFGCPAVEGQESARTNRRVSFGADRSGDLSADAPIRSPV